MSACSQKAACNCNTTHLQFRSSKDQAFQVSNVAHRRGDSCGRRVVSPLQVLTGFLIYDWIEKPHKQEVIKEVLSLLEQKILEPNSGEAHLTPPLCLHSVFLHNLFFKQFSPLIFLTPYLISLTHHYLITHVSQKFAHCCVSKIILGLCHVQRCMASR